MLKPKRLLAGIWLSVVVALAACGKSVEVAPSARFASGETGFIPSPYGDGPGDSETGFIPEPELADSDPAPEPTEQDSTTEPAPPSATDPVTESDPSTPDADHDQSEQGGATDTQMADTSTPDPSPSETGFIDGPDASDSGSETGQIPAPDTHESGSDSGEVAQTPTDPADETSDAGTVINDPPSDGGEVTLRPDAPLDWETVVQSCPTAHQTIRFKLNRAGGKVPADNLLYAQAVNPILAVEARIPDPNATRNPRSEYKHGLSAVGPAAYETLAAQPTIPLLAVDLKTRDVFGPKFKGTLEIDGSQVDWDAATSTLPKGWQKVLVAFYVCDDTNQDGRCSDEKFHDQVLLNPPVFELCKIPQAVVAPIR